MSAFIDGGYRRFEGRRTSRLWRWLVIAQAAVVQNWKSKLLRRLALFSWAPLFYFGLYFFAIGQLTQAVKGEGPSFASMMTFGAAGVSSAFLRDLAENAAPFRVGLWTLAFYYLTNYTQLLAVLIVPALVGPGLIADDRRRGALQLYFSRPISTIDYLLGKFAAIALFVSAVSLFPILALYAVSILTSPSVEVLQQTWPVLVRVVIASLAMILPTSILILFLSSLTPRRSYLAFLWVGFVIGSFTVHRVVAEIDTLASSESTEIGYSRLCSYGSNLAAVASGALNAEEELEKLAKYSKLVERELRKFKTRPDWRYSMWILLGACAFAWLATFRLVRTQDRGWG